MANIPLVKTKHMGINKVRTKLIYRLVGIQDGKSLSQVGINGSRSVLQ